MVIPATVSQLLVLACLVSALAVRVENYNHLVIAPQSPVIEIGTNFTATCMIINTNEVTADDLYWNVSKTTVPREQYTKINQTALNVTLHVTNEQSEWLFCFCKMVSANVFLNEAKYMHGIYLQKGYRPGKPKNLSCRAEQEKTNISPTIQCSWVSVGPQTKDVPTAYTLFIKVILNHLTFNVSGPGNSGRINLSTFPHFMEMEIWVEARNKLGTAESEHLRKFSDYFVKTNPPANVSVISENGFPTSLLVTWCRPIDKSYVKHMTYQIRFRPNGANDWTYVPQVDIGRDIQSFRLQYLKPHTEYVTQVRCKTEEEGYGYWSEWSNGAASRTPEDRPTSKPDVWKVITEGDGTNERHLRFMCKDPVFANGRIIGYDIKIQDQKDEINNGNGSLGWEYVPVNRSETDSSSNKKIITILKEIHLAYWKSVKVYVTAKNSAGKSPSALLVIPDKTRELPPVEGLKLWTQGRQLWVEWKPLNSTFVTEYVVEWVSGDQIDWQRENRNTSQTTIKGKLEKFVCYRVSVYPIYSGWIGKPASMEDFLEQGVPLEGPNVQCKARHNEVELMWKEIPQHERRGFITNYTVVYTSENEERATEVPVSSNTTSYTLMSLLANTRYKIRIRASTIAGSVDGPVHEITTLKYAPGEIDIIVVGVSLGFLFVVVITMLICFYKKDVIKRNFWPQIPDPGESTIGNWSPDHPLKAEAPKENSMFGISVLDVDECDGKCVFEEDKASLPLKKDKYLSEEHSSGIGGSSCMSSPRQSMSDSDEGGDITDTTASTIQYSSVVASNGYKGQTPSSQPQQATFSRSESTQPLLDSEENSDMLVQEGSRGQQSQRLPHQPHFIHATGNKDGSDPTDFNQFEMEQHEALEPLVFCPLEEDPEQSTPIDEQSTDWLPATSASSYMPQLGGYRPQ